MTPPTRPDRTPNDERPGLPEPVRNQLREVARMDPPDDLYRSVLRAVDATPQRRRRLFDVPDWLLATAVTAVVVVAIGVGLSLRSAPGPAGNPTASPPGSTSPAPASPPPATTRYESDFLPWAIDLPGTWTPGSAQGDDAGSYETFNRYQPSLVTAGVGSTAVPAGTTGQAYLEQAVTTDTECAQGAIDRSDTTMGGEPAVLITYECEGRNFGLVATIRDDRRYIIAFEAADPEPLDAAIAELLPAFEFTD